MKKTILFAVFVLLTQSTLKAQDTDKDYGIMRNEIVTLKTKVQNCQSIINRNRLDIISLSKANKAFALQIDSLNEQISELKDSLVVAKQNLSNDINKTNVVVKDNRDSLLSSIKSRTVYGILGLVSLLLLSSIVAFLLRKKVGKNFSAIEEVKTVQRKLEEESLSLDNELVKILDKQVNSSPAATTVDHSLALKVADEITRIELNLSRMDPSIKGYKQLTKGIERIKNNFLSKGYEIADMLGKVYNEGMRINADFVLDESLEPGTRIITSITKPQVIFNGELIQKAIVTVTQNI
ncbi:hypothetical protein [Bacteroides pyogenes]|uniref:hypothetical protein n=1 Tax=Bacteroides pyogenes TaxID=310300 RepID=UPI001F175D4E|nr:hypothetical protein [Bacteroides pyogenes]MCE9105960.1 hypothetical protein [Bacteroides pyogenes]